MAHGINEEKAIWLMILRTGGQLNQEARSRVFLTTTQDVGGENSRSGAGRGCTPNSSRMSI